jgi:hypothetical protein
MPWKTSDVAGKTKKAKTAVAKRQWRDVANSSLKRGDSEAVAIRKANAVIARRGKKKGR